MGSVGDDGWTMLSPLRVRVRPYADLARYFPGTGAVREVDVPAGTSIEDLLRRFGVDAEPRLTIGLNGELAQRDAKLAAGDVVDILVPMTGGE